MIRQVLTHEIEQHAARVRSGRLMSLAERGLLTPAMMARYLASLRYLLEFSAPFLARARDLARSSGRHALADFFHQKVGEETGHHLWAVDDLTALQRRHAVPGAPEPVPAIQALVEQIRVWIETEPALYLAYNMWAEYFTSLAGGEFVKVAIERCDIPADALTCLSKHVELDVGHAEEDIRTIAALVDDPALVPRLREVVVRTAELFDRACEEFIGSPLRPTAHFTASAAAPA